MGLFGVRDFELQIRKSKRAAGMDIAELLVGGSSVVPALRDVSFPGDEAGMAPAAFKFHYAIAVYCGNFVYPFFIKEIESFYVTNYVQLFRLDGTAFTVESFRNIIRAIKRRNEKEAVRYNLDHIEYGHHIFREQFRKGQKYETDR